MLKDWYYWYFIFHNNVLKSFNYERRLQPSRPEYGLAKINDILETKNNWNYHEPHGNIRGLCIYEDDCSTVRNSLSSQSNLSNTISTKNIIDYASVKMELQLGQYNYRGGMFVSKNSYKYGIIEARIKTYDFSCWPSFWMYSISGYEWNEIDIMEFQPKNNGYLNIAQHTKDGVIYDNIFPVGNDWHNKWHYYYINWEPGLLRWYVDDICIGCSCKNVPDVPMIILLSLEIDENKKPIQLPKKMDIDYIRVYQK